MPKVSKSHLGKRHLNQLSGESARGTKVGMKQKFGRANKNKAIPNTQYKKAFGVK